MTFRDMISMSVGNLWRRKLRTFLTVLGVLIGTTSIVAMLSIAFGMKQMVMDQYSSYGSATQINVYQGYSENGSSSVDHMLSDTLIETLSQMDHVVKVKPVLTMDTQVSQKKYSGWGMIYGIEESELQSFELEKGELPEKGTGSNLELIAGNMIPIQFYDSTSNSGYSYYDTGEIPDVDLFSSSLRFKMYNEYANTDVGTVESDSAETSIGYTVDNSMIDVRAKVTGLMSGGVEMYVNQYSYSYVTDIDSMKAYLTKNFKKGQIPGQPKDGNDKPYNEWIYNEMKVEVDQADNVDDVKQAITDMGFMADSNKDLLESSQKTFKIIELVLGGIGMISFLVATIGIANTMMMSTYERTKEIGIMKVLGCDMRDIMGLFLAEAGFIGFLGGVVGVALTKILSVTANNILANYKDMMGLTSGNISVVPLWLMVVAIVFATLMGMVAGFFPARRAMKLSPLAAIRNE